MRLRRGVKKMRGEMRGPGMAVTAREAWGRRHLGCGCWGAAWWGYISPLALRLVGLFVLSLAVVVWRLKSRSPVNLARPTWCREEPDSGGAEGARGPRYSSLGLAYAKHFRVLRANRGPTATTPL